jgi:hypothetical protein
MKKSIVPNPGKKSTQDRALKTIAIRPTDRNDVMLLDNIKKATNESTYSGALMRAGAEFVTQLKLIQSLGKQIGELEKQVREANRILNLHSLAAENLSSYSKKFLKGKHYQPQFWE